MLSPTDLLVNLSPEDERWDLRREITDNLALFFLAAGDALLGSFGLRMLGCANFLRYEFFNCGDELKPRLTSAWFCRVRLCAICMWRHSKKWLGRFMEALPEILVFYPKARWLHLTLTIRNPQVSELPSSLDQLACAWSRLTKTLPFKRVVLGYIKTIEVTRGKRDASSCHPHLHCLLLVSGSYFGRFYIKHSDWVQMWREVLAVNYSPSVRIQIVSSRSNFLCGASCPVPNGIDPQQWQDSLAGAVEVLKYVTSPTQLMPVGDKDPWLVAVAHSLHNRRLLSSGGVLKSVLSQESEESEDLLGDAARVGTPTGQIINFSVPSDFKPGDNRRYKVVL